MDNYQNYKNELKKLHRLVINLENNIKTLDLIVSLEIMKSEIDSYNWRDETIECYLELFNKIYTKLREKFFWDTMRKLIKFQREIKDMYKQDIINVVIYTKEQEQKFREEKEREDKEEAARIIAKGEAIDI